MVHSELADSSSLADARLMAHFTFHNVIEYSLPEFISTGQSERIHPDRREQRQSYFPPDLYTGWVSSIYCIGWTKLSMELVPAWLVRCAPRCSPSFLPVCLP